MFDWNLFEQARKDPGNDALWERLCYTQRNQVICAMGSKLKAYDPNADKRSYVTLERPAVAALVKAEGAHPAKCGVVVQDGAITKFVMFSAIRLLV